MPNLEQQFRKDQENKLAELASEDARLRKTVPLEVNGAAIVNPLDRERAIGGTLSQIGNEASYAGNVADTLQSQREAAERSARSSSRSRVTSRTKEIKSVLKSALSGINDPDALTVFDSLDAAFQKEWISDLQAGEQGPGLARQGASADDILFAYQQWLAQKRRAPAAKDAVKAFEKKQKETPNESPSSILKKKKNQGFIPDNIPFFGRF